MAKDKKCNVTFNVTVIGDKPNSLYICGNIPSLGDWTPSKAKEVKLNKEGIYSLTIKVEPDTIIEFKVLKEQSWQGVDKGMFGEEIENHVLNAEKGAVQEVIIYNWADSL